MATTFADKVACVRAIMDMLEIISEYLLSILIMFNYSTILG